MTKTLKVSDETYNKIKDQLTEESKPMDINTLEDFIGQKLFFRTVTYHMTGRVVKIIDGKFLQLEDAAWIADSGRFMQAIKEGDLDEVEPTGETFVAINSIVDIFPWNHDLPGSWSGSW